MFRCVRSVMLALIVISFAASLLAGGDEPEILVGTVVIRPGSGPEPFVLIAVDVFYDGVKGDGIIDHVYKFYTDASMPDVECSFTMAFVQHEKGRLVVTAPTEKVKISFLLGSSSQPRSRGNGGTESVFAGGRGLSHYWGETVRGASIRNNGPTTFMIGCGGSGDGAECFNDWDNSGGGGGCQAGGVGSTSCSLTVNGQQCSVDCHAGYACCKYVNGSISCKCVN